MSHTVFVYGTLKRGFTNYLRYLGVAERHGKALFVGGAETREAFPMVIRPKHIPPPSAGPVLMDRPGVGHRIQGEVFQLDDNTLEALDILEGVRNGFYYKRKVDVRLESDGERSCDVYFFPAKEELLALPYHPSYTEEHHSMYCAPALNQEILELCRGSHGLCTLEAAPITAHCLRLLPGEDIVKSLRSFAQRRQVTAAVVLTCVGSTGLTTLRPAGVKTPRVFTDKYEIVSLTGTLSNHGHHLHMSISDASCNVFGGHVLEGCLVRTTAEITLGIVQGLNFTRPLDPRTGYDELSILPLNPTSEDLPSKRLRSETNGSAEK
eukprot:TRINITY_DN96292_c0_g1_i1.p1 TRINITY_DN96292_c0_g1~~TRINITY_DN96292_c0_g1_i1.p1  ORF type:complete len:322 (-),score=53.29 TRINITY_DN96292_c0_g1_i1:292-1257(-)